nr:Protein C6orf152 [Hymenolepis microstoma]
MATKETHSHDACESDTSLCSPNSHCTLYRLPALKEPFRAQKRIQRQNPDSYPKSHGYVTGFLKNHHQIRERQRKVQPALSSESGLGDTWEANQNLIASLRSENHYLKSQLKECQGELKTVQRQCKVQNARLTKAVGKESERPELINRLNDEIRALQFHLNRQREATAVAEKRATDAETRLRERREVGDAPGDSENFRRVARKQTKANEALKNELENERRKSKDLQRKVDAMERKLRTEQNLANERIRKFRKSCTDLQTKLEKTERNLQNIYSQRIPKKILIKNTDLDFLREANRYIDEAINSVTTSYRQVNRSQSPPTLTSRSNKLSERSQSKSQEATCTNSNVVATINTGHFTSANGNGDLGASEKLEHTDFSTSMGSENDRRSQSLDSSFDRNSNSTDSDGENVGENSKEELMARSESAREGNITVDGKVMEDFRENIDCENKTIESASTTKIPALIDEITIDMTLAEVTNLQAQMERMILHHESLQNNGDSPTNLEKILLEDEKLSSTLKTPEGATEKVATSQKDELPWNIFGKKELDQSTMETMTTIKALLNSKKTGEQGSVGNSLEDLEM